MVWCKSSEDLLFLCKHKNNPMKKNSWYKWEVLLLLWMAYLLNQGDRQVFNTVLPAIRDASAPA